MNWDLTPLFNSINEAEEFLKQALFRAEEFEKKYKNRLYTLNEEEFIEVLKEYEDILENIGRSLTYIYLIFATDSSKGNFLASFQELATKIEEHLIWFELEFIHLPIDKQQRFIDNAGIYKYYLIQLQEESYYKLNEKEEKILMKKDLTSSSAFIRLFDETLSKLKFFFEGKKLSEEEVLSKLYSSDRNERKKAQVSLTTGLKTKLDLLTYIYNQIKKDFKIEYVDIRGYESVEDVRHLKNRVSKKSVDNLVKVVNENTNLVAEYYNLKRDLLGYERLYDYDRYAPLKLTEKKEIPFEEAKNMVLNAFKNFSNTFYEIALKAFEENWIDVYPKEGKRGGAFSHSATPKAHPYVLLNYTNQRRDVFTLAHELGHAIHQYLARDVGYLNQDTPLTTAETASIFAEMLLFEEIKKTLSKEELIEVYAAKLEDIFATLFRQIVFTNFERRVHSEEKELSTEEFNKIWMEENQKMFKDSVYLTKNYEIWWSYIPHFIHSPFYCYSYSYAQLLVLTLYKLYKEGFENFEEKYIKFLSQGGSLPPKKQFETLFNLDIEKEDFWEKGIDIVREMVNEFKGLIND